jgi:2-polyprenyl-3-methyl-5-hydroxy-6-metoxy-1,4-benzoquinol methylase
VNLLSFSDFDKVYQEAVNAVFKYWTPQMQMEIAAHCYGWRPGRFDFRNYLRVSSIRFYKAYRSFAEGGKEQTICDIGGFWGVWPVTLKALGYKVTMTESLQYYSHSFDKLFNHLRHAGVNIIDYDPFREGAKMPENFNVITVMAVLEHYPHSLKIFMENIVSMVNQHGKVYIEVPNIAFWHKRVRLMFGQTPLVESKDIYKSAVPFIGHHHEFTMAELKDLVDLSGLSMISENFYNYSPGWLPTLKMFLRHPIRFMIFLLVKDNRECIAVLCKLKHIKHEQSD